MWIIVDRTAKVLVAFWRIVEIQNRSMKPGARKVLQQASKFSKAAAASMRQGRSYDIVGQRVFNVPVGTPILTLLIDTVQLTFSTRESTLTHAVLRLRNSIARV